MLRSFLLCCYAVLFSSSSSSSILYASPYLERPIVIWHGMGDSCCSPEKGTGSLVQEMKKLLPHTYIKAIGFGDSDDDDKNASFYGNLLLQLDQVCEDLSLDEKLNGGFDAIGFSQGGLFMRALAQHCPSLNMSALVTLGSPHLGVADIPNCEDKSDFRCGLLRGIIKRSAYSNWAQTRIIQAQFYKDVDQLPVYLEKSRFLPVFNNERKDKNDTLKNGLLRLEKMVLVLFKEDKVVIPKETAWFGFYNGTNKSQIIPLGKSRLYQEDWLGLRTLNESGRLFLETFPGAHMRFTRDDFVNRVLIQFLNRNVTLSHISLVSHLSQ